MNAEEIQALKNYATAIREYVDVLQGALTNTQAIVHLQGEQIDSLNSQVSFLFCLVTLLTLLYAVNAYKTTGRLLTSKECLDEPKQHNDNTL
jgi:hypothetical protein